MGLKPDRGEAPVDLSVAVGTGSLANPVGVASGTFGYGEEYAALMDLGLLGAVFTKAVTWESRPGNAAPRLVETPAGLLNSIGLANRGVEAFIRDKLPYLSGLPCAVAANVAGSTEDDYLRVTRRLEEDGRLWGYEINLSCPNVRSGCLAFGTRPRLVEKLTRRLRRETRKPLVVKLTPNVTDVGELARAAEAGGADAVSCINTLLGMAVDVKAKRPVLPSVTGGLSGPAVRPVGVAVTYRVGCAVSIPVIGIGGIMGAEDALEYLLAGASAVQIGTGNFIDPSIPARVLDGIRRFCRAEGLKTLSEIHKWKVDWQG
jgi:dihydroorotate dehydrogenase (NAD+) catalytic subunit